VEQRSQLVQLEHNKKMSHLRTHEGHVTHPSDQNVDFVDISMEIVSALQKAKLATSVDKRTIFSQGAEQPTQR